LPGLQYLQSGLLWTLKSHRYFHSPSIILETNRGLNYLEIYG
jgi:hypothetical protein